MGTNAKPAQRDPRKLPKQYGCGPAQFMGEDGLDELHLVFDIIKDPIAVGTRDRLTGLEGQICRSDSSLDAFVVPTDEELLIARDTVRCILSEPRPAQTNQSPRFEDVRVQ